jgi:flagellar motor switch protein FliM
MTAEPFDFRRPPPGGLEGRVADWLTEACGVTARSWAQVLPFPAHLRFDKVEAVTATDALRRQADEAVGLRLTDGFSPAGDPPTGAPLMALGRPLLLALVGGALGDVPTALPDDRGLTPVEDSLAEWLLEELFLAPLKEAWPTTGTPPLRLALAARGIPRKVTTLPPDDVILLATMAVEGPFGRQPVGLLLPRSGLVEVLGRAAAGSQASAADPGQTRNRLEALVGEMPADLVVTLGAADVPLSTLARLAPGDLVILGQRASDPLTARVGGVAKYRVWPGRVGRRRAIQVVDAG